MPSQPPRPSKARPSRAPADPALAPPPGAPTLRRVTTPRDTNLMGTVFGGAILAEIDLAAAVEAHKAHPGSVVTVAMDKVIFKRPVFVGDLISLYTRTVRVGTTSITVQVSVWADRRRPPHESVQVTEATVTMVAVDDELHPVPVGR
jgi:acyl-CoA thioesterase YciA